MPHKNSFKPFKNIMFTKSVKLIFDYFSYILSCKSLKMRVNLKIDYFLRFFIILGNKTNHLDRTFIKKHYNISVGCKFFD